jgi:hypothetical protein
MIKQLQENKFLVAVLLVVGIGGVLTATQTDLIDSVTGEEPQDHSGEAMEAGQAMKAQEDLGEESMDSGDSMDSEDSMNGSMMENGSTSMEQ